MTALKNKRTVLVLALSLLVMGMLAGGLWSLSLVHRRPRGMPKAAVWQGVSPALPPALDGRVVDAAGHPVGGAKVSLLGAAGAVYDAKTGPNGNYALPHLAPGKYVAIVRRRAAVRDGRWRMNVTMGVVTVGTEPATANFAFRLAVAGRRRGAGFLQGRVVDARGRPVRGAVVVLMNNGVGYVGTAGSGGRYVLAHVVPGQYVGISCLFTPPNGDEASVPRVVLVGAGITAADFRLHWIERPSRAAERGAVLGPQLRYPSQAAQKKR